MCACSVCVCSRISPWQKEPSSAEPQTKHCLNPSSQKKNFFSKLQYLQHLQYTVLRRDKKFGRSRKEQESGRVQVKSRTSEKGGRIKEKKITDERHCNFPHERSYMLRLTNNFLIYVNSQYITQILLKHHCPFTKQYAACTIVLHRKASCWTAIGPNCCIKKMAQLL